MMKAATRSPARAMGFMSAGVPDHAFGVTSGGRMANKVTNGEPSACSGQALADAVRRAGLELGFVSVGFASAEAFGRGQKALDAWLAAGQYGEMGYMAKHRLRHDPKFLLPSARTIVSVALPYARNQPTAEPGLGLLARYARGGDYHAVIKGKLAQLQERITRLVGRTVLARSCVDSAPLLEREAATRAGVGFIGKSTLCIVPSAGSYLLLGELLIDIDISPDSPLTPKCGQCTACLDACPTKAFTKPYVLDARRCISYLTIELRGPIPRELRRPMGNLVFGCDSCQEVCPYNASPKPRPYAPELAPKGTLERLPLTDLLRLRSGEYRRLVRGTAFSRTTRHQLARNAAIAVGNSRNRESVPVLEWAAKAHSNAMVRGHGAWALGQIGGSKAREILTELAANDLDAEVRTEATLALADMSTGNG